MPKFDTFKHIVKSHEYLFFLGRDIIRHKEKITTLSPKQLMKENDRQYERINEFTSKSRKLHKKWKKNEFSINKYWTGLD